MNLENEVEGRRRLNSDPGKLEASKASALPGVEYGEASDFRRQHHNSGATPRVSARVRANVMDTLSTIYNPFVYAIMSMNDASFEELDVVERIEHLLEISKDEEAAPLVDAAETKGTTLGHAFLSLLQAFVGTGILFLPQGFQQAGIVIAPIMLTITTLINVFCMFRLLACRELVGGSYSHIGEATLGVPGRWLVQTSLVLMQMGFCCSYMIFVALNLHDVFVFYGVETSIRMLLALQTLIYIPLSWIRYLRYFTISNLIGNIFVLYAILYILYTTGALLIDHGVKESIICVNERDYTIFIGTAVFVFEGVGLIIPTQASLSPSLQPRFKWLLLQVVIGLIIFFSVFASINYAAIGNNVKPMILSNLPRTTPTMSVQAGYAFAQTLAFPLFLFPAIRIIEDILGFPRRSSGLKCQKNTIRCLLVLLTAVIADAGKAHLDLFVSLVGACCCVPLTFLYPPWFYLRLAPTRPFYSKASDYAVILIGVFILVHVTRINLTHCRFLLNRLDIFAAVAKMPLLYKAPRCIGAPFAISHDLHVEYNYQQARFEVQGVAERHLETALNQHFSIEMRELPRVALEPYEERIPAILVMLEHHFVRNQGHAVPYIFRESPGKADRDDAIAAVNSGTFCGDSVDVRIVADLIKVWFRELPTPLLHKVSMEDMDKFMKMNSTCVPSLDALEHSILLWLADLLLSVAQSERLNHMGIDQLAIILAPNLIRIDTPNPTVAVAASKASVDFLRHFLKLRCAQRAV